MTYQQKASILFSCKIKCLFLFSFFRAVSFLKNLFLSPKMVVILKEDSKYSITVKGLPENYNFEIQKTLRTIERLNPKKIALQFPDGLLCYAPVIIDTVQSNFNHVDCVILNDVVYGACCVDDQSLDVDLLIHYGHSCLIPVSEMNTRVLYVFVDVKIDVDHLYNLILSNFTGTVAIIGTIQFNSAVNKLKCLINNSSVRAGDVPASKQIGNDHSITSTEANLNGCNSISSVVPQIKPLSPGEVLGCTSPVITGAENVVYIGDGRFHLESAMIRNPNLNFFKYCPFTRKLSREFYDFDKMKTGRMEQIRKAYAGKTFGVILGSLGRQGNKQIFSNVQQKLVKMGYKVYRIVLDEINERLLDNFDFVDAFVQVSCPRLSIDWGVCYRKPLLSPFELFYNGEEYSMDYYSNEGSAPWKNYNNQCVI